MMPIYSGKSSITDRPRHTNTASVGVQKVVVVNSSPEILTLAERVLAVGHYDVVFVESLAHAYSQIRRVQPNLVVLCLRLEDRDGFQLLSMLKLDPLTRKIPVLTYAAEESTPQVEENDENMPATGFFAQRAAGVMN
jgi:CheY-like chemotaxis protein